MRISDWSSDVCSSDLGGIRRSRAAVPAAGRRRDGGAGRRTQDRRAVLFAALRARPAGAGADAGRRASRRGRDRQRPDDRRYSARAAGGSARIVRGERRGVYGQSRVERKSVGEGKGVSVRVDLGGRRIIKKK